MDLTHVDGENGQNSKKLRVLSLFAFENNFEKIHKENPLRLALTLNFKFHLK